VTVGTLPGSAAPANLVIQHPRRDQAVVLAGLTLDQRSALVDEATLTTESCEGLVVIQDAAILKSASVRDPRPTLLCQRSALVFLDQCVVRGFETPTGSTQAGGTAVRAFDCRLDFNACDLFGGYGDSGFDYRGYPALSSDISEHHVHGGSVRGGDALLGTEPALLGGVAVDAGLSDFVFSGGPDLLVQGGSVFPTGDPNDQGAVALNVFGGTVLVHPGAEFEGGLGGTGIQALKWFPDNLTVYKRAFGGQRRPGLAATPPSGSPGAPYELEVHGTPLRLQTIVVGRRLNQPFNLTGYAGLSFLDPDQPFLLFTATTDSSGVASIPFSTPPHPKLVGTLLWQQSFETQDPDGRPLLGLPTCYRIR
ncbi:MAG: hypothetical protein ACYS26_13720, partial [Planctomycetota bacterium]